MDFVTPVRTRWSKALAVLLLAGGCQADADAPPMGSGENIRGGRAETRYPAVGALVQLVQTSDGRWSVAPDARPACVATLVGSSRQVAVSSAHCFMRELPAGRRYGVRFLNRTAMVKQVRIPGPLADALSIVLAARDPADATPSEVDVPGAYDAAIVVFEAPVQGIQPASIAEPQAGSFLLVGYDSSSSRADWSVPGSRRSLALSVRSPNRSGLFRADPPPGTGMCYGDSGGPLMGLDGNQVVSAILRGPLRSTPITGDDPPRGQSFCRVDEPVTFLPLADFRDAIEAVDAQTRDDPAGRRWPAPAVSIEQLSSLRAHQQLFGLTDHEAEPPADTAPFDARAAAEACAQHADSDSCNADARCGACGAVDCQPADLVCVDADGSDGP